MNAQQELDQVSQLVCECMQELDQVSQLSICETAGTRSSESGMHAQESVGICECTAGTRSSESVESMHSRN